jgi:hypothetical protein
MFEHIASSITVGSICSPVNSDLHAGDQIEDLTWEVENQSLDADELHPWPVRDSDGEMVGMIWEEEIYHHLSYWTEEPPSTLVVRDVMNLLHPNELISSATTILDAVELFATKSNRECFYVVHVNEVVGVLRYGDLQHPLARLAFLTLALEIEDLALLLCQSDWANCWTSLAASRKEKAREVFKKRYGKQVSPEEEKSCIWTTRRLIACTHLVDKANMIWKKKLIPAGSRREVLGFFEDLRKVRDRCAHPGGDDLVVLPREKLAKFIQDARAMRENLLASNRSRGMRRQVRPWR